MPDNSDRQSPSVVAAGLVEWGPGKTARGRARLPSSRRRDRPQLSCNHCRQRKLRCDRQQPCANCTKRVLGDTCAYPAATTPTRPPTGVGSGSSSSASAMTVQDRIKHLEGLLVHLMRSQQAASPGRAHASSGPQTPEASLPGGRKGSASTAPPPPAPDASSSPTTSDCGSIHLTKAGASYVNSAHWAAVLDGIAELKGHFEEEEEHEEHRGTQSAHLEETPAPRPSGPQLLYGCSPTVTKEEILASIPPRPVVDQLVSCYFNSFEMSPALLHSVQFLQEYDEFWKNPPGTPIVWIGLLFTIMCLASQFQKYRLDPGVPTPAILSTERHLQSTVETFQQRTAQCLILGDYVKGGPNVLETLMLYLAVELYRSNDAEMGVWILLGTITQLAMHMGYHRDPKHFGGLTPFASEMQRRVWITIVELDLSISSQMGLPRLIKPWQADTTEPSNLQDRDFNKHTVELPPSRPETDLTPILYRLVKARILGTIGAVWDFATDIRPYRYADVMSLEQKLQDAHDSIPLCLKWRSNASSIADLPQEVMQKVSLEIVVNRARIVLYRRYLRPSTDPQHIYSRQKCLGAALNLLEFQHILQEKTEPFGQLYHERWRISSLVKHDFLLATSILCSYLQQASEGSQDKADDEEAVVRTIRDALWKSHDIWARSSGSSKEAQKAAKALSVVLGIASPPTPTPDANTPSLAASPAPHGGPGDYLSGMQPPLSMQFPTFDATWASWPAQTGFEPMVPFSPQVMDAMDAMNSNQWPWSS